MKEWIHPEDPYRMNWVGGKAEWGTIQRTPEGLAVETVSTVVGDTVVERYTFTNVTDESLFTGRESVGLYTPFNDDYDCGEECLTRRCHTHLFCGGEISYVMTLRMNGEGPHLGLVLTEGSLCGYSVERDLSCNSNDRGDFILHISPVEMLAPGASFSIGWTLFWHEGKDDFYRQLPLRNPRHIDVRAEEYMLFTGETAQLTIQPAFSFEEGDVHITRNGEICPFTIRDGRIRIEELCTDAGERIYRVTVGGVHTSCRLLVQPDIVSLAEARCRFIARHQQICAEGAAPDGAYVIYDNEEERRFFAPIPDYTTARERVGMGILLAQYLSAHPDGELEASLRRYRAFLNREVVDTQTGTVSQHHNRWDPFLRLYNYPFMARFYMCVYRLWQEREDLLIAYRIMKRYYALGANAITALLFQ